MNRIKLDFTVPEKYGQLFGKGKTIRFTVAGSNRNFSATVIATESAVATETRSLKVRASVVDSDNSLLPGTFAKVMLNMAGSGAALIAPTQAIIPQARGKKVVVYKGGNPEFRDVETGVRDEDFVQVLSGLQLGDTVVTTGLLAIRPNSKLVLKKVE